MISLKPGTKRVKKHLFPSYGKGWISRHSGPVGNQHSRILLTWLNGMNIRSGCDIVFTFTLGIPKACEQTGAHQDGFVSDVETGSFHFEDC